MFFILSFEFFILSLSITAVLKSEKVTQNAELKIKNSKGRGKLTPNAELKIKNSKGTINLFSWIQILTRKNLIWRIGW